MIAINYIFLEIDKFAFLLRKCDVMSKTREVVHLIDENGCIIDDLLLNSLKYNPDKLEITAETKIFKFIDESEMRFMCNIVLIPKKSPTTKVKVKFNLVLTINFNKIKI